MAGRVVFERVWKQFERGERHDSLRDLLPSAVQRLLGRRSPAPENADAFWAVRDVSFEVNPGEALGIIGRNGAGKSTILKLLTRILKPTRGTCRVSGRAGALIEVAAGFHPDLTGRENVFLQGAIMGMKRHEITSRFDAIVAFAGLGSFIDTPVKRYSSGMNARLGFSIAAHLNPDVLLIDEVLAVGDRAFQQRCYERMKEFREQGVAIVFVSHHLPVVAQLCTHTLLLDQGATVLHGTPREAIAAYTSAPGAADDGHVSLSATLRAPRSAARGETSGDVFEIAPGDRLQLDVELEFRLDVDRSTVGVVIWDLTREIYVYGASSDMVGVPLIRAKAGEHRRFSFTFDAHLTRGLYAIEVNVVEAERFLAFSRGLRHFSVVENVSYDGIANLYLAGREAPAMRLVSDKEAAAR